MLVQLVSIYGSTILSYISVTAFFGLFCLFVVWLREIEFILLWDQEQSKDIILMYYKKDAGGIKWNLSKNLRENMTFKMRIMTFEWETGRCKYFLYKQFEYVFWFRWGGAIENVIRGD